MFDFFLDFLCNLKSLFVSDNSEPKIIFCFFLSIFVIFFKSYLKVGSLFASDNSEPKIIFRFYFDFLV